MATKKIKINFKMPTPTAAERLHAQQQKNRKAASLPDPSEYKKKLDSMKSEEVEQLDEISPQLKASYVAGAKKQIKQSLPFTKKTDEYRDIAKNFIAKRQKGIARANEEVEQLDEIGDTSAGRKTLGNYINRSHESGDAARIQATYDKDNFAKHTKTVAKRSSGIAKAVTRLTKEQLEKKGRFVSGPIKQPFKSNTIVTAVKEGFKMGRGNVHEYDRNPPPKDGSELENTPSHPKTELQKRLKTALTDLGNKLKQTDPRLKEDLGDKITVFKKGTNIKQKISANSYDTFKAHGFRKEEIDQLDEKKNLPGLWANIRAKRKRGEPPAKPGDKDYPKTLNIESAAEPTEGEMKGKQGYSRKAQIVMNAAKGKKSDSPDKFQKDPELSSEIHKT
jgi:hypothetical protein